MALLDAQTWLQPEPWADTVMKSLRYFSSSQVAWGFRSPKQRGIPKANFPEQVVDNLPADVSTGIYYGWASVGSGDVDGCCEHRLEPLSQEHEKSVQTHIMHTFKEDFYGEILSVAIVGYLKPEKNFNSLEKFISAIQGDSEEETTRFTRTFETQR